MAHVRHDARAQDARSRASTASCGRKRRELPDPRPHPARRLLPGYYLRVLAAGAGPRPVAPKPKRPRSAKGSAVSAFSRPSHSPTESHRRPAGARGGRERRRVPARRLEGRAERRVLLRRDVPADRVNRPTASSAASRTANRARRRQPRRDDRAAPVRLVVRVGPHPVARARPQVGGVRAVGGEDERPPAAEGQLVGAAALGAGVLGVDRLDRAPGAVTRSCTSSQSPSCTRRARSRGPGPGTRKTASTEATRRRRGRHRPAVGRRRPRRRPRTKGSARR